MKSLRIFALASAALVIANPAFAASPNSSVTGKDASAATVTLGAVTDGTLKSPTHGIVDPTGAIVSPATSTNQATEIASLATIASNTGAGAAAPGSAVPSSAIYIAGVSSGNLTGIVQADASAKVSISTNTITQVVALVSSKKIYVTNFNLHSAGTTTSKWVYGTGSNCGTGTTDLTDLYDFTASDGMTAGNGLGPVLVVPASNALCISNSAAVHVGGSVAYTQF